MKKLIVILLLLFVNNNSYAGNVELPEGFVYINDIDPSIKISLRYNQNENFIGEVVQGCDCRKAVVTIVTAEALHNVQEELAMYGYSLVIYDAYRPSKTYSKLDNWLQTEQVDYRKNEYYPNLNKAGIIKAGYIKEKTAHVRGSTVDVTIMSLNGKLHSPYKKSKRSYKDQQDIIYMDDGSVDMGTSYDFFDPLSAYANDAIPSTAKENRKMLRKIMQNYGFIPNEKFWWQFTLVREPYRDSEFDFDV